MDFNLYKKDRDAAAAARKIMTEDLKNYYIAKYGAENVSLIGDSEIAICIGIRKDKDGYDREVVATIKPVIKKWRDCVGEKTTIKAFDRYEAAEEYEYGNK